MNREIVTKVCQNCNKEYQAIVLTYNDEQHYSKTCESCTKLLEDTKQLKDYREKVAKINSEQRVKWKNQCGITGIFTSKNFDNFNSSLQPKAYKVIKNHSSNSIVLLSANIYGVGKTHLVCALGNYLIENINPVIENEKNFVIEYRQCPFWFITEYQMLDKIRDSFNRKFEDYETENEIYEHLINVPLLIIDDVGKIKPRDYAFLQGVYYRVIDGRYVQNKPIIMTTNLDFAHLEEHIGGASADRLKSMCGENMIKMVGKSYRQ